MKIEDIDELDEMVLYSNRYIYIESVLCGRPNFECIKWFFKNNGEGSEYYYLPLKTDDIIEDAPVMTDEETKIFQDALETMGGKEAVLNTIENIYRDFEAKYGHLENYREVYAGKWKELKQ